MNFKRVIFFATAVAGAGVALWLITLQRSPQSSPPKGRPSSADQAAMNRFLEIEAREKHLDETIWANEILAQEYETIFVDLWDQLRLQPDPWAVLGKFPFDELKLRTARSAEELGHGILRTRWAGPARTLKLEDWRELLGKFQSDGYRIAQSEWRQTGFRTQTNAAPHSTVAMSVHAFHAAQQRRFVVRGKLEVEWRARTTRAEALSPASIEVADLEILERPGETAFENVLAKEIEPKDNTVFIDPLIVYDLDGDGLDEIVLACRNLVFRNLGGGRFQTGQLCTSPTRPINAAIIADFDGDAAADLLAADSHGVVLYSGTTEAAFKGLPKRIKFTDTELPNPFVMTAGDVDADGDLDIWLAQYKLPYVAGQMPTPYFDSNDGFPSFLLTNNGRGEFVDATAAAGLASKRFRRTYSSSFVDLDADGDLDLVVVSDFAGIDLYFNDGRGRFTDETARRLEESHAFGMAHTFGDYDLNGALDLCVIGMNSFIAERLDGMQLGPPDKPSWQAMRPKMSAGNRLYFGRDGVFKENEMSRSMAQSGWSWGVTSADFDNDRTLDLYIANGHKSRASVRDYESQFWRHDVFVATSEMDPSLETYFQSVATRLYGAGQSYGGYYKNSFYLNRAGKSFVETGYLMGLAMETDCRNVVGADLDADGRVDLLVTTFEEWPRVQQTLQIFRNRFPATGNWIGFQLREQGGGLSPCGAKVIVHSKQGKQLRYLVTGDSYRSQHPTTAHFGLGSDTQVDFAEIIWPNGKKQRIENPSINQYHRVRSVQ